MFKKDARTIFHLVIILTLICLYSCNNTDEINIQNKPNDLCHLIYPHRNQTFIINYSCFRDSIVIGKKVDVIDPVITMREDSVRIYISFYDQSLHRHSVKEREFYYSQRFLNSNIDIDSIYYSADSSINCLICTNNYNQITERYYSWDTGKNLVTYIVREIDSTKKILDWSRYAIGKNIALLRD